jgi:hypothetical protein
MKKDQFDENVKMLWEKVKLSLMRKPKKYLI